MSNNFGDDKYPYLTDGSGKTALLWASEGSHSEIIRLLLEKGADIDAQDGEYGNALQGAVRKVHLETAQLLLANGADVNARHQSTAEKLDQKDGKPSH